PTPLDPYNIKSGEIEYYGSAEVLMTGRLDAVALATNMSPDVYEAIADEIRTRHSLECNKNATSFKRLRMAVYKNPERLTDDLREIILRARAAKATTEERIELLTVYPETESIEDMKVTCPLDIRQYTRVRNSYHEQFLELQHNSSLNFFAIPTSQYEKTRF